MNFVPTQIILDMSNYCVDSGSGRPLSTGPAAVPSLPRHEPAIRDIRFTRRIARQCSLGGSRVPEWAVCDTIANGSRTRTPLRGAHGGRVLRFERSYPLEGGGAYLPRGFRGRIVVLGERTRRGCLALRILFPALGGRKSGMIWDF
jgi:hypothetical protein